MFDQTLRCPQFPFAHGACLGYPAPSHQTWLEPRKTVKDPVPSPLSQAPWELGVKWAEWGQAPSVLSPQPLPSKWGVALHLRMLTSPRV